MKKSNSEFKTETRPKKKKAKIIRLNQNDLLHAEMEYEKYYNRIRLLSKGI